MTATRQTNHPTAATVKTSVNVWLYSLVADATAVEASKALLSADELARAGKFTQESLQHRFILARAGMRRILGNATDIPPQDLIFRLTPTGKPHLAPETPRHVHFNLSHTSDIAALAICEDASVGVDIEAVRPLRKAIARRYFTAQEADELDALPEDERLAAFFRCWTRKEAFLKATGEGIARGLESFQVSLSASEPARLISIGGDQEAAKDWVLFDFSPDDRNSAVAGIAGAVAVLAPHGAELEIREYEGGN
jgi:4'-phosphopantetheinyl transferase